MVRGAGAGPSTRRRNVDAAHRNVTHAADGEGGGTVGVVVVVVVAHGLPVGGAAHREGWVGAMVYATRRDAVCGAYGNCIGRDGDWN